MSWSNIVKLVISSAIVAQGVDAFCVNVRSEMPENSVVVFEPRTLSSRVIVRNDTFIDYG